MTRTRQRPPDVARTYLTNEGTLRPGHGQGSPATASSELPPPPCLSGWAWHSAPQPHCDTPTPTLRWLRREERMRKKDRKTRDGKCACAKELRCNHRDEKVWLGRTSRGVRKPAPALNSPLHPRAPELREETEM